MKRSVCVAALVAICSLAPELVTQVRAESPPAAAQSVSVSEQEAYELGVEAYHFFYPLVSMEVTRRITTNLPSGVKPGVGPMNMFHHMRAYPTAEFRDVVRPNFDTLYSSAWLDLTKEPMIISAPATEGRYYLLPMLDMWTDVFASPGKRTSGTDAAHFAIVPPGWRGTLPKSVQRIDAPTTYVWVIGRTQTNGVKDYDAVHKVQDGYTVTALSRWGKAPRAAAPVVPDPKVDMKTSPLAQVNGMSGVQFLSLASELMKANPPHITDWSATERFRRIGVEPGKPFNPSALSSTALDAINRAAIDALKGMVEKLPSLARVVNGWQMNTDTMGVYGNYYLKRAIVAMVGLGANQPEDAVYPMLVMDADGEAVMGEREYQIHFKKEELPPANAFWSITMYDEQGFQVANPIDRFAIGDRDALQYNDDGSLDIYIQHESPGAKKESNWLPAPASGKVGITMRLYSPKPQALDGRWAPPVVTRED